MSTAGAEWEGGDPPLRGVQVLTLAVNLPGPVAASRLCAMGASVIKVEPPGGDPLALMCPSYYRDLSAGQEVVRLDLKDQKDRVSLDDALEGMDLLLTASRPAALGRLGLSWPELHVSFPRLCQVAIAGHPPPNEDAPGHDLTYQARFGTLSPQGMPPVLVADLAGAERAVSAALALLFARERGQGAGYEQVALSEAVRFFAEPLRQGLTAPGGILGNGFPGYGLYRGREGHVALGALEPHFWERLLQELGVEGDRQDLGSIFETKTAEQWEEWAADRDLPLAAVRDVEQNEVDETASASQRRRTSTRGEDE
ncbi:MAG: CoA transferase [Actinomycetota bacterium]|nr:CoA transferase [Rubrobacteraceae bacterium]MDQ3301813.1 CoA transferase [Actinomycetota bacterium]MDQ3498908.1 CoA transferase [Actinomycetota bacterium]